MFTASCTHFIEDLRTQHRERTRSHAFRGPATPFFASSADFRRRRSSRRFAAERTGVELDRVSKGQSAHFASFEMAAMAIATQQVQDLMDYFDIWRRKRNHIDYDGSQIVGRTEVDELFAANYPEITR